MSIEREAKLIASAHADLPDFNGLVRRSLRSHARQAPPRRHLLRHQGTRPGPLGYHTSGPHGGERAAVDAQAARRARGIGARAPRN